VLERETLDQTDAYRAAGVGSSVEAEHNGKGAVAAGHAG
jgi:hypothetical protein